jgi:hypothetical protein
MSVSVRCGVRVHRHAADRIDGAAGFRRTAMVMAAVIVIGTILAAVTMRVLAHSKAHLAIGYPVGVYTQHAQTIQDVMSSPSEPN